MHPVNMRHIARKCVCNAKALLLKGDTQSIRYACLELRFAIEYIIYDQLEAYKDEVSDETLKKWTPKQLIAEMLKVDPYADKNVTVSFAIEDQEGVPASPQNMEVLGTDNRFSMKWANKNHNALGNFLHAPTISQLETDDLPTAASILPKAKRIAEECEKILSSPIFGVNLGNFIEFSCEDCGFGVRKRIEVFQEGLEIKCPQCRATYGVAPGDKPETCVIKPHKSTYTCKPCGTVNAVGSHRVVSGSIFVCKSCHTKVKVVEQFSLVCLEDKVPPSSEKSE